jgi:glyoxylase-like metal-dependent hydrolase (beta-lactamase superfamily II)
VTVKIYAMTCGWLTSDLSMMLAGKEGRIHFPVPAYLIDHPRGQVLFDTGLHPQCQHDPKSRIGFLAELFSVHFREGEDIQSRLEQLEIDANSIEFLVNSHLHFDHTGGNELVPNAKVIIQKREWEAGHTPEFIKANGYAPADYDHGHLVQKVDGEHDIFGDGRIVTVPTFGHTPGHQSLKIRLDSGDIVLTADACYLKETLANLHLPHLVHDRAQMLNSLLLLRKLQKSGARIFYGHDPEFWAEVPQAPRQII